MISNEILSELPLETKRIIESPKVTDAGDLKQVIKALYKFAADYQGLKASITDEAMNTAIHYSAMDIEHHYPYLRLEELTTAVNNGARGVYGENYGLNAATFNKWITHYIQQTRPELMQPYIDRVREINQRKTNELIAEQEKQLQDEMKNKYNLQTAIELTIDLYRKHRIIMYGGGQVYNSLLEKNEIQDNWQDYVGKVEQWVRTEKFKRISSGRKHNDLTDMLNAIESNNINQVQLQCRQMILQEWIERQIKN